MGLARIWAIILRATRKGSLVADILQMKGAWYIFGRRHNKQFAKEDATLSNINISIYVSLNWIGWRIFLNVH